MTQPFSSGSLAMVIILVCKENQLESHWKSHLSDIFQAMSGNDMAGSSRNDETKLTELGLHLFTSWRFPTFLETGNVAYVMNE